MRISEQERTFIREFWTAKDKNRQVYLFGSRTQNEKKGGDIDILILSDEAVSLDEKMNFTIGFYTRFGEQKLDLVDFTHSEINPFKNIALSTAIEL